MANFRWIWYHTCHSSGYGTKMYKEIDVNGYKSDASALKSALSELEYDLCTDSEHWRGVKGDFCEPPREVLIKHVKDTEEQIKEARQSIWRAQQRLFNPKDKHYADCE